MGNFGDFRGNVKSIHEIRQTLQRIWKDTVGSLGTMSLQDSDNVNISGGAISGTDIDMTGQTLALDDDQIDVDKIGTTELDTTKRMAPDGAGGVEWVTGGTVDFDKIVTSVAGAVVVDSSGNVVVAV